LYSPISQIPNSPQRALQSTHTTWSTSLTFDLSHRIRKNSPWKILSQGKKVKIPSGEQRRRIPLQDGGKNRRHVTRMKHYRVTTHLINKSVWIVGRPRSRGVGRGSTNRTVGNNTSAKSPLGEDTHHASAFRSGTIQNSWEYKPIIHYFSVPSWVLVLSVPSGGLLAGFSPKGCQLFVVDLLVSPFFMEKPGKVLIFFK